MGAVDILFRGWMAAALTLATFVCRDMRRLCFQALPANAAFIAYAKAAPLWPVLVLHLTLVPVNLLRLAQAFRPSTVAAPMPSPRAREQRLPRRRHRSRTWRQQLVLAMPGALRSPCWILVESAVATMVLSTVGTVSRIRT